MTVGAETAAELVRRMTARLRAEEPEWGHLPAAARYKRRLVAELGVERAFNSGAAALQVPGLDELVQRDVSEVATAGPQMARSFTKLWSGGETIVHPPMRVRGDNNQAEFRFHNRVGYLALFENVALRGRSALISMGDRVLIDAEGEDRTAFPDTPEYDPGVLKAEADRYWMMRAGQNALEIDEAFMLSGSHTVDFGHWMIEYLPKLALACLAGLPPVPVLIDQHVPQTMVKVLRLLVGEGTPLITVPHLTQVSVRRLWYAANPLYKGSYPLSWNEKTFAAMGTDAGRFALLIRELKRRLAPALKPMPGFERVFLARKPHLTKKRLQNHLEIEQAAAALGFRVIYPEEFSFLEQVQIAMTAKFIAAPEGSNTYIAFFASPGCRMLTLNSPYVYPLADINAIVAAAGVDLRILTGPYTSYDPDFAFWSNYRIDVAEFREEAAAMLEGR